MKRYIYKEWKLIFATTIVGWCCMGLILVNSILTMQIFQGVIDKNLKLIIGLLVANMFLWITYHLLGYVNECLRSKVIAKINNQIRESITQKIINLNYQEFYEKNSGDYISWYLNDVNQIETQGVNSFLDFVYYCGMFIANSIALLYFHWGLLLVCLVESAISILLAKGMQSSLGKQAEALSDSMENYSDKMKEQIAGASVVRNYNLTARFCAMMQKSSRELENSRYEYKKYKKRCNTLLNTANSVVGMITMSILFLFGMTGLIPISTVFGGGNILSSVSEAISAFGELRNGMSSAKPIFQKSNDIRKKDSLKLDMCELNEMIAFNHVSFAYDNKTIIKDLSLKFNIGGKYAIIGESGSGKTTILRLIMGYLSEYEGRIFFDDKEEREINSDSIQNQIAYIEQDVFLYNEDICENILLDKELDEGKLQQVLEWSALSNELIKFENGLHTIVGENGRMVSGGQKQRIAIARALYHDKKVLLMDEGTSALDRKNAEQVEDSLLSRPEITLILVSHNLTKEREQKFTQVYRV